MKSPGWRKVIAMTIGKRVEFSTSLFYGAFNYSKIKAKVKEREGDKERNQFGRMSVKGWWWLAKKKLLMIKDRDLLEFRGKVISFVDVLYRCFFSDLIWNLRHNRAMFAKCYFRIISVIISALEKDHVAILKELIHATMLRCISRYYLSRYNYL